jgi:hypothetical protein
MLDNKRNRNELRTGIEKNEEKNQMDISWITISKKNASSD